MSHEYGTPETQAAQPKRRVPWLEWLAAGIGLLLGAFGVIGWQAFNGASTPPMIIVDILDVGPMVGGYRVLFQARNGAGEAATQVEIEGKVTGAGTEAETSRVILDDIRGHSTRRGGLFFTRDPRSGTLAVRAMGFAEP